MIIKMNNLSDKIVEYKDEVMNSLLTFDIMQAHLKPGHIQNCCFEDFEYVYRQALSIEEVRTKPSKVDGDLKNVDGPKSKYWTAQKHES